MPDPTGDPREPRWPTLASAMAGGRDNLTLLRLCAALAVVYSHGYLLSGVTGARDVVARLCGHNIDAGGVAVDVFFVLSGFLLTSSWLRRPDLWYFVRARALRILPALVVCLLGTVFVLGTVLTRLPRVEYLTDPGSWQYLARHLMLGANLPLELPGVFTDNPYPTVNGSLWTLSGEVRAYAWLAAFGVVGLLRTRRRVGLGLLLLGALALLGAPLPALGPGPGFVRLGTFFVLGVLAHTWRDRLPLHGLLVLVLLVPVFLTRSGDAFDPVFGIWLAYTTLWGAYRPRLPSIDRMGDCSYGVYLWGFPVEQVVVQLLPSGSAPLLIAALTVAPSIVIAAASWHLVEGPALRLKGAGRRTSYVPRFGGTRSVRRASYPQNRR